MPDDKNETTIEPTKVRIVSVEIPFIDLMNLLLKIILAAVPAAIAAVIIIVVFLAALSAALGGAFHLGDFFGRWR